LRNESETRADLIDPLLTAAGWGSVADSQIRREYRITKGRLMGAGQRGLPEVADYILVYRNTKLAVIEAKAESLAASEGVAQAKFYAEKLAVRIAYATNGHDIYRMDLGVKDAEGKLQNAHEGNIPRFPTPEELWNLNFAQQNEWRDRFAVVPFQDASGSWDVRYYQETAIQRTLDAIADNRNRVLLTLATGTGKTAIAFQICWKLFNSKWNISREPTRRPRILFLADRNGLADQAFGAFAEDARARISPKDIRKAGKVPTNASIFFTIFQTFMSGTDSEGQPKPYFGQYPPDFFDFIIIDECHRGGANDESSWRAIMDYFSAATQLGLTATPRREENIDTYKYFGDPVYIYSLKQGINDGFLTPFKVHQIASTMDEYVYVPDDVVIEGDIEENKRYLEKDFNVTIEIAERERYRVRVLMSMLDQKQKTIVFCANQAHAARIRDLINQERKDKSATHYCVRVTANDGALGDQYLKEFQDNEKTIPTILTTSQKLSTGVDARNVRNIVLLRPIKSMIEFKQIIGRGTRLYDGKDYFTIFDFVKASEKFQDPEWDGEPVEVIKDPDVPKPAPETGPPEPKPEPEDDKPKRKKIVIKLADGKERAIQHMTSTLFYDASGKPMSANQMIEQLFGVLPAFFKDDHRRRKLRHLRRTALHRLRPRSDHPPRTRRRCQTTHPPDIQRQAGELSGVRAVALCRSRRAGTRPRQAVRSGGAQVSFGQRRHAGPRRSDRDQEPLSQLPAIPLRADLRRVGHLCLFHLSFFPTQDAWVSQRFGPG
jgi:type I restriction enzyme R subunit